MIQILKLTPEFLKEHVEVFCQIDLQGFGIPSKAKRTIWTPDHFLCDLPGKWKYSRRIMNNATIVGYYIASRKMTQHGDGVLHGHRVALSPSCRPPNLLLDIYKSIFDEAHQDGLAWFTGHQPVHNRMMLAWYLRILKCRIVTNYDEVCDFLGTAVKELELKPDGRLMSRNQRGKGQYLIVRNLSDPKL